MTRKLVLAYKSIKYQLCILKAEWYQILAEMWIPHRDWVFKMWTNYKGCTRLAPATPARLSAVRVRATDRPVESKFEMVRPYYGAKHAHNTYALSSANYFALKLLFTPFGNCCR